MTRPDPEAILAALDPEQRAAAEALHGPVVVLAGAGTGKTRAITHRIAHGVATGEHDPRRCLAVTFTTRAAGQMRGRLAALGVEGVQARTFHAAALRQLRFFWPRVVGGAPPEILPTKARLVAAAASRERVGTDPAIVRDLAAEIEWAKSSQVVPDAYAAAAAAARRGEIGAISPAHVARVYAGYEALKTERHEADFEDVLLLTVGILDDRPDVADEVRAQYRWFTVDEYQDVNPLQQRLLDLWLGERDDLCVVGDAAQTIYTFAGATPSHLLGFRARYPHATEVRLVRSYRCSPQIVSLANAVLASAVAPASAARLVLRSEQPDGEAPQVLDYRDEKEEAEGVAARIAALVASGTAPRDIAVLYRVNAASEAYEEALGERGIAVDLRGAERFFDRPEVRQAITLLRGAARAGAGPAHGEAGSGPAAGADLVGQVHDVLAGMGWTADPATAGTGATGEKWANLGRLATLAGDLAAARPEAGLDDLVADLSTRAEHAHVPAAEAVTLASLHAAKGLEWPVVFLVGLTDGMLPISYADTPERVEEERRLFYVGVTRAARLLTLSWAQARTPGGRRRSRSRFLDDVAGQAGVPASQPRVVRGSGGRGERKRRGPATCRVCGKALVTGEEKALGRCRGCPSTFDEALLERAKAWRKQEAAERGVPAYVVFTDRTLLALAELDHARAEPWRREDLLEVSGIGAAKLEAYGDALLELLAGPA